MKTKQIITVCLLAAFLAGFGLWGLLRTPGDVSQAERRPLAQWPELTVSGFLSGQYAGKLEHAAADQFPLREQFRTLRSLVSYDLLGQRDVDGVYLSGGYAAKLDFPLNPGSVDRAAQRFRYVYDTYLAGTEANVYLSVIPDKGYFLAPASGRPAMDYDALVSRLREGTPEMTYIDLFDRLTLEDYYRTDAHWRQERLRPTADTLLTAMGAPVSATRDETLCALEGDFHGSYWGKTVAPLEPDTLSYLISPALESCTVHNYETDTDGGVYDFAAAQDAPYDLFLSGSRSLLRIDNPNALSGRTLVVFRDSFGSSIIPLLSESYRTVYAVDIRYLASDRLGRVVDFPDDADVLLLYSTTVLHNSITLK